MSSDPQRLFDIPAATEYLRSIGASAATRSFVRTLINTGQITHMKISKKFYVSREALDGWIARAERRVRQ